MDLLALFKTLVPPTADYTDEVLEVYLQMATDMTSAKVFGKSYRLAICYLAGHFLVLSTRGDGSGVAGPVIGRRAGEVSENYGFAGGMATSLDSTSFGQLYRLLQLQSPYISPINTVLPDMQ